MISTEIQELAIIFLLAAAIGIVARLLRQPLILAYMLAGVVIGVFGLTPVATNPTYQLFADLGIMFLLFLIGMEINLDSLKQVGPSAMIIGFGQIIFTFVGGFFISLLFGFEYLPSAYIAIALTFSSTIIVVKLLSEKRDLYSLYGKISVGFLLVQDFAAVLILLVLASLNDGRGFEWSSVVITLLKGFGLMVVMLWLGRGLLPKLFDRIARSPELLFTASLAWLLIMVTIVERLGFSIEIGGFLAGLALANSSETFQIGSRIKPLRDFFLLLFFIVLGSSLAISDFSGITWPAIVFSLFVLIGNPIIVMIIMGSMGYHRRTSFLAGVTVAQISEFSLVLIALGHRVGHVRTSDVTLVTLVGVITITLSSYLILNGDRLYRTFRPWLGWFERRTKPQPKLRSPILAAPVILIGAHRTGQQILTQLPKSKVVVIDFDPDIVNQYRQRGYASLYGDISDPEIFEAVDFSRAQYVISTSPDLESNRNFLSEMRRILRRQPSVLIRAESDMDAQVLYAAGADYVARPQAAAGQTIGQLVLNHPTRASLRRYRRQEIKPVFKTRRR